MQLRSTLAILLACAVAFPATGRAQSPEEATPARKSFIDYFLPMPVMDRLTTDTWGAPEVLPRDPGNGLEDTTAEKYSYWDGQIIEGPDGRFHLFASRWNQEWGHGGWMGSLAVHAIADHPIGPYVDQGLIWPDYNNGVGHNVTALKLHDGRYAAIISDTRPGEVFIADSLDGPWSYHGNIEVDNPDGYDVGRMVNLSVILRPDGDYMIVPRSGVVLISKNGILGPYRAMGPSIYPTVEGLPLRDLEDPVLWYSGGLYHVVVNGWSDRKAWHITSEDGITSWKLRGLAYDPREDFIRYEDGTVNHWFKLERPGVLIQDGHVTHVTLSAIDVEKDDDRGNDRHSSKVIVIPFDGKALDRDLAIADGRPVPAE